MAGRAQLQNSPSKGHQEPVGSHTIVPCTGRGEYDTLGKWCSETIVAMTKMTSSERVKFITIRQATLRSNNRVSNMVQTYITSTKAARSAMQFCSRPAKMWAKLKTNKKYHDGRDRDNTEVQKMWSIDHECQTKEKTIRQSNDQFNFVCTETLVWNGQRTVFSEKLDQPFY